MCRVENKLFFFQILFVSNKSYYTLLQENKQKYNNFLFRIPDKMDWEREENLTGKAEICLLPGSMTIVKHGILSSKKYIIENKKH